MIFSILSLSVTNEKGYSSFWRAYLWNLGFLPHISFLGSSVHVLQSDWQENGEPVFFTWLLNSFALWLGKVNYPSASILSPLPIFNYSCQLGFITLLLGVSGGTLNPLEAGGLFFLTLYASSSQFLANTGPPDVWLLNELEVTPWPLWSDQIPGASLVFWVFVQCFLYLAAGHGEKFPFLQSRFLTKKHLTLFLQWEGEAHF